jgi:hypothetical protein
LPLYTLPQKPQNKLSLLPAYSILERTCESAEAFFTSFATVRKARKAKGTATDHEQDLIRAALMFAAAGLDSMIKHLAQEPLHIVISKDKGAHAEFAKFVQSRLSKADNIDVKFLAEAITAQSPFDHLKRELTKELTASSLQSKDQVLRAAAFFAIPAEEITNNPSELKTVFDARNQIAHEMDIQLGQPNRGRRQRKVETMRKYTTIVLRTAAGFYSAVDKRL